MMLAHIRRGFVNKCVVENCHELHGDNYYLIIVQWSLQQTCKVIC
jgi:hypothetical protein